MKPTTTTNLPFFLKLYLALALWLCLAFLVFFTSPVPLTIFVTALFLFFALYFSLNLLIKKTKINLTLAELVLSLVVLSVIRQFNLINIALCIGLSVVIYFLLP
ncbi:hypothetical protein M1116_02920 [Patescibacteria group bacterium]|nr:hypothetical protein [Patescibacteria group bacterium]